ncbi:hypothetical protein GALL_508280 [mine drainage metagenome]|uniref:Uncharacterized protein n=1 Tax=mine drainage metagenome TaxID=410659 RepID=A0A1J5PA21_9ZZZZ
MARAERELRGGQQRRAQRPQREHGHGESVSQRRAPRQLHRRCRPVARPDAGVARAAGARLHQQRRHDQREQQPRARRGGGEIQRHRVDRLFDRVGCQLHAAAGAQRRGDGEVADRFGVGRGKACGQRRQQRGQRQAQPLRATQSVHARRLLRRGAAVFERALQRQVGEGQRLQRQRQHDADWPEQGLRGGEQRRQCAQRSDRRGQQHPARRQDIARHHQQSPHAGLDPAAPGQRAAHPQPRQPTAQRQREQRGGQRDQQRVAQGGRDAAAQRVGERVQAGSQRAVQQSGDEGFEQEAGQRPAPQRQRGQHGRAEAGDAQRQHRQRPSAHAGRQRRQRLSERHAR